MSRSFFCQAKPLDCNIDHSLNKFRRFSCNSPGNRCHNYWYSMTYVTLKFSWCFCTNRRDVIKADTNYLVPVSNFWDHYWLGGRYMFWEFFFFSKCQSGSMLVWISILSMPIFNCGSRCSSTVQSVQIFLIITQRSKSSHISEIKVTSLEKNYNFLHRHWYPVDIPGFSIRPKFDKLRSFKIWCHFTFIVGFN